MGRMTLTTPGRGWRLVTLLLGSLVAVATPALARSGHGSSNRSVAERAEASESGSGSSRRHLLHDDEAPAHGHYKARVSRDEEEEEDGKGRGPQSADDERDEGRSEDE